MCECIEDSTIDKFSRTLDTISTSYHEAGHVLFALLNLMRVDYAQIYIDENKRVSGITYYISPECELFEDERVKFFVLNSTIGVNYAGLIAEKLNYKRICGCEKFPLFLKDGSSDDNIAASKLIHKFGVATTKEIRANFKKEMKKEITEKISSFWGDLSAIAHLLFNNKKVKYAKLKSVLINSSEHKKFWVKQFDVIEQIYNSKEPLDERAYKAILKRHKVI